MDNFDLSILKWYRQNKRNLPWRNTNNPYFIWLSEIILQQTRVDQGMDYYLKFINNFPTIQHLANADEQTILSNWQGLGYYSRARNLHATAKEITFNHNGNFPNKYEEILKLKGIGPYTAAAISSFSFNLVHPVVDGNVFRVLTRIFDIDTPIDTSEGIKLIYNIANKLIPTNEPGEYNQAIMEFGAIHCTPSQPNCDNCIFSNQCKAKINGTILHRPIKSKKIVVKKRYFHYLDISNKVDTILHKRTDEDIWKHLFEFPLIEKNQNDDLQLIKNQLEKKFNQQLLSIPTAQKHVLSHQHIFTYFWQIKLNNSVLETLNETDTFIVVHKDEIIKYPLPRVITKYLENINKIDN